MKVNLLGTLTRAQCYELDELVNDMIDSLLASADRVRIANMVNRLSEASCWLTMIQRCVASDDAVIKLDQSVSVVLWDAHIELEVD